ncbi:MAG: hypothetical protein WC344_00860 [Bacilli bacterium]|jgi:hypothetical protein
MTTNEDIQEYSRQIRKGQIPEAYRAITKFMAGFKAHLEKKYPTHLASALYPGYLDMTYFAFTPPVLATKKLKIAIVYLHAQNAFEIWLSAVNKNIQSHYIQALANIVGRYKLSSFQPGVDSIVELRLPDEPNFDHVDQLESELEHSFNAFLNDMLAIVF